MNGVGTNLKFGVIYRPIPEIRLGAAIHTPTWYNMNYSMATSMYSSFYTSQDPSNGREGFDFDFYSPDYSVDFNMRTPWRAMLSVATILKTIMTALWNKPLIKTSKIIFVPPIISG